MAGNVLEVGTVYLFVALGGSLALTITHINPRNYSISVGASNAGYAMGAAHFSNFIMVNTFVGLFIMESHCLYFPTDLDV